LNNLSKYIIVLGSGLLVIMCNCLIANEITPYQSNSTINPTSMNVQGLIPLNNGANLVSFNILPENTNISSVFESLGDTTLVIFSESSLAVNNGNNQWVGGLDTISDSLGYWIIVSENTNLIYQGSSETPPTYNLHYANNLISYPFSASQLIVDALDSSVLNNLTAIFGGGNAYVKIDDNWYGSLRAFNPDKGYWFSSSTFFNFQYNDPSTQRYLQEPVNEIRIRDDLVVNQSTQQSFYMVKDAMSNGNPINEDEIICAYCNDKLVGYRYWSGEYTDVPAMGDDNRLYSTGYCQLGDEVKFTILDDETNTQKEMLVLTGSADWQFSQYTVIRLTDVQKGDVTQDYILNVQDIIPIIDHILLLNGELTNDQLIIADMFNDGIINVTDIVMIVETILN